MSDQTSKDETLLARVRRYLPYLGIYTADVRALIADSERLTRADGEFKNFHRLLCERFGCVHDEVDWRRDQLSLIEHIAKGSDETVRLRAVLETIRQSPHYTDLPGGHIHGYSGDCGACLAAEALSKNSANETPNELALTQAKLKRCQEWARIADHHPNCAHWKPWSSKGCTCGLIDVLAGLPVEPTPPPRVPPRSFDIEGHMGLYPSDELSPTSGPEKAPEQLYRLTPLCICNDPNAGECPVHD